MAHLLLLMLWAAFIGGCISTYDYYTIYVDNCGEPIVDAKNQKFVYDASTKTIKAAAYNDLYCLFAQGNSNPVAVTSCNASDSTQHWTYSNSTNQFKSTMSSCLDVYDYSGDNIEEYPCKTDGSMSNQQFAINTAAQTITNTYNNKVKCMTLLRPQ